MRPRKRLDLIGRTLFRTTLVVLAMLLTMASRLPVRDRWPVATPDQEKIDGKRLNGLFAKFATDPTKDLKGIVILRHGKLVAESYFNGDDSNTLHDIRSATKSITATLMGIAIQQHIINGVDDSIADYLPNLPHDGKQKITIRDLLNMRSGLDVDDDDPASPGNETRLDESTDWIKSVYAVPMKTTPGAKYIYVSINAFLVGAIIENASKCILTTLLSRTFSLRWVLRGTSGDAPPSIAPPDRVT